VAARDSGGFERLAAVGCVPLACSHHSVTC
jgi:hypothetical protein